MAKNPFVEGCTEPMAAAKRLCLAVAIGIIVAFVLSSLERHIFFQNDVVVAITAGIGAVLAAGLSFVALGGIRDRCDLRDAFDFYTKQGAPPNVAKALTMQISRSESMYGLVMLVWIYTCARIGHA